MTDRVLLGQYEPGDSFIHHVDPRIKILLTLFFMGSLFFMESFLAYLIVFLWILLVVFISKVQITRLVKGLKPIIGIVLFTFIINVLVTPGEELYKIWIFSITRQGLIKASFITVRIVLLVFGTTLLTLTTSPLQLTDGLESLFKPLSLLGFPSHALAMMISIALRFIPTLFDEADTISRAQKARGADFESGNIMQRAKAMVPLMVPLFLNSIQRAEDLAMAMEARCYRGGEKRTRLNPLHMQGKDWIVFFIHVFFFILLGLLF